MVHSASRLHQSKPRSPHTRTPCPRVAIAGCGGSLALTYGGSLGCGSSLVALSIEGRFVSLPLCRLSLCHLASSPYRCAPADLSSEQMRAGPLELVLCRAQILSRTRRLAAARAKRGGVFVCACARRRLAPTPWRAAARVSAPPWFLPPGSSWRRRSPGSSARWRSRPSSRPSPRTQPHEVRLPNRGCTDVYSHRARLYS